jgi:hypothetical protein
MPATALRPSPTCRRDVIGAAGIGMVAGIGEATAWAYSLAARRMGLKGLCAHRDRPYTPCKHWVNVKNPKAPAAILFSTVAPFGRPAYVGLRTDFTWINLLWKNAGY